MLLAARQRRHDEGEGVVRRRVRLLADMRRDQHVAGKLLIALPHVRQAKGAGETDDAAVRVRRQAWIFARQAQAAIRADDAGGRRSAAAAFAGAAREQDLDEIGPPEIAFEGRDLNRMVAVGQQGSERIGGVPRIVEKVEHVESFTQHSKILPKGVTARATLALRNERASCVKAAFTAVPSPAHRRGNTRFARAAPRRRRGLIRRQYRCIASCGRRRRACRHRTPDRRSRCGA